MRAWAMVGLMLSAAGAGMAHDADTPHWWTPVRDEVYPQEVGYQIALDRPVNAVALYQGAVYAGMTDGIQRVKDFVTLEPVPGAPDKTIVRLATVCGALWALTPDELYRMADGEWTRIAKGTFLDVVEWGGAPFAVDASGIAPVDDDELGAPIAFPEEFAPILAVATHLDNLYFATESGLAIWDGKSFSGKGALEFGVLPEGKTNALVSAGSRLIVATESGLGLVRGSAGVTVFGADGLPYEDLTCAAPGFAQDFWLGAPVGAIRWKDGSYDYFQGQRWLPNDTVHAIACGEHTVYFATDGGLGIIDYEPYTLEKKAAYMERHLSEWGQRRGSFVHKLFYDRDNKQWQREVSDNDVGYSVHYWSAQAFKYAATGDPSAHDRAVKAFKTMKCTEEMTGVDGFIARSLWYKDDVGIKAQHGSGGLPAEWHASKSAPDWEIKADTSSDEVAAQFYYSSVFYDLVANEEEKKLVADHLGRILSYIVRNGYRLLDYDGNPTRWGRWDQDYFSSGFEGMSERPLASLEILGFTRCAWTITGDPAFGRAYGDLVAKGYPEAILDFQLSGMMQPAEFDDELALFVYYYLGRYETDPHLSALYRRAIERWWESERIERNPWYNFVYGMVTGSDCDVAGAVGHLREWPLDLRKYSFNMKQRTDLHPTPGYVAYGRGKKVISPRERGGMKWEYNPYSVKEGGGGMQVEDPCGWLCAYWLGRYAGFILPPDTDDPDLLTVPDRGLNLGAEPYTGPELPCECGIRGY